MAYRQTGYQYDTNPRKLKPEYEPKRNPYSKKKTTTAKKKNVQKMEQKKTNEEQEQKAKNLEKKKSIIGHIKTVFYILLGFSILFAISYRNSLITEKFNQKEDLKKELNVLQKENAQTEISIQNSLNLSNIEKSASEKLGMKKIDESQKVYVNLPKKDYVQPASEQVLVTQEKRWYEKLFDSIRELFQ